MCLRRNSAETVPRLFGLAHDERSQRVAHRIDLFRTRVECLLRFDESTCFRRFASIGARTPGPPMDAKRRKCQTEATFIRDGSSARELLLNLCRSESTCFC